MYLCICVSVSWPFNSSLYITISERCFLLTRHGFVFRKSMEWCYRARAATSATDRTGWQQLHGERFRRMVRTTVSRDLERRAPIKSRTAGPSCTNNTSWCKFVHSTRRCSRARSTPFGADRTGWKKIHGEGFHRMVRTTVSRVLGPCFPIISTTTRTWYTNTKTTNTSTEIGQCKFARSRGNGRSPESTTTGRCCGALSPSSTTITTAITNTNSSSSSKHYVEPHLAVSSMQACFVSDGRPCILPSDGRPCILPSRLSLRGSASHAEARK